MLRVAALVYLQVIVVEMCLESQMVSLVTFIQHSNSAEGNATISFVMSVCLSAWNNSVPTGRILMKFDIWRIFRKTSTKFNFHENLTKMTGTLHEDL